MSAEGKALVVERLKIGYRLKGGKESVIAEDLSLALNRGELVCLLGPNGAGKSTLIRSLAGIDDPLSGRIELDGSDARSLTPKQRARLVSVVLTDRLPTGLLSAYGLVALGRHPHTRWSGTLTPNDHSRIEWAMDAVGIGDLAQRQVGELSDGELQKVMIARALAQEASVLLLDEPTAFVDLPRRVELMRILRQLAHREGIAVLLSSHDLELSLRCADKLWLMASGGAVVEGMPESLALNGEIAAAFASDKIDWDVEQGSFRMHREPQRFAHLEGEGEVALWTRRALLRVGYGIYSKERAAEMRVVISQMVGKTHWSVQASGKEQSFDSLEAMIAWIGNDDFS